MAGLLDVVGLRFRERRGALSVEPNGDGEAAQRVRLLGNLGIDVHIPGRYAEQRRRATLSVPVDLVPMPLSTAVWSGAILQRQVPPVDLFAAILADERAALLCHGLAGLDDADAAVPGGAPAGSSGRSMRRRECSPRSAATSGSATAAS